MISLINQTSHEVHAVTGGLMETCPSCIIRLEFLSTLTLITQCIFYLGIVCMHKEGQAQRKAGGDPSETPDPRISNQNVVSRD